MIVRRPVRAEQIILWRSTEPYSAEVRRIPRKRLTRIDVVSICCIANKDVVIFDGRCVEIAFQNLTDGDRL